MRIAPPLGKALAVYAAYNAVVFATWAAVGADYADLASREVVAARLVLPMALGAALVAAAATVLGWWRPVLAEPERARPAWPAAVWLGAALAFVATTGFAVDWSRLAPGHVLLIALGTLLVGFNEEAVNRGVLVTGLRASGASETRVCLVSSVLFGAMHLPNALFGMTLVGAPFQFLFATAMGLGFYALRRASGTLVLPMVVHAAWDFVSLSSQTTRSGTPVATVFQVASYALAILAVVLVLRSDRRAARARTAGRAVSTASPPRRA